MKKIVFITTSLADKGPNQQLLNIIKRLDRKQFKPVLISLTNPIKGDKYNFFKKLEIDIHFLGVKKLTAIFSFIRLKKLLSRLEPQLIHSHGFLSDLIIILTRINIPHILTIRCDPYIDYPTKFGLIPGNIMAFIHIVAIRLCPLAIACSESLQLTFKNYNVNTKVVRNGVDPEFISDDFEVKSSDQKVPIFITAGSLIPRKNVELMISIFCSDELRNKVKFKVLGDGFLMSRCQKLAEDNILILGHIDRPYQHLSTSQFYISLSESEGMPNSVIEALMVGLPCVYYLT